MWAWEANWQRKRRMAAIVEPGTAEAPIASLTSLREQAKWSGVESSGAKSSGVESSGASRRERSRLTRQERQEATKRQAQEQVTYSLT